MQAHGAVSFYTVGMTGSDTLAKTLQNVSRYVEMNLSNIDSVRVASRHDFSKRELWIDLMVCLDSNARTSAERERATSRTRSEKRSA